MPKWTWSNYLKCKRLESKEKKIDWYAQSITLEIKRPRDKA